VDSVHPQLRQKARQKIKKRKSDQSPFDVSAALLRSEKLYDKLSTTATKEMLQEEENNKSSDKTFSEFVVAARYSPSSSNQQRLSGSSSVSDWTPVAQICLSRPRNSNDEDGRLPPQLTEAISIFCREIHHAAVTAAPVFASLPRNDVQYSVETVDSFHKFVYDFVLEERSSKKKHQDENSLENMSIKEAREELGLEDGCADLSLIKKAYRSLSFKYHPDRFISKDSDEKDEEMKVQIEKERQYAQSKFSKVKHAYELLLRSGVTATGPQSSQVSGASWYASLGGRERTDFKGPLELIQLKVAQKNLEQRMSRGVGYESAICGLDPDLVNSFIARNQANAAKMR